MRSVASNVDRQELFTLVVGERYARDVSDWDALVGAYSPSGVVRVTWFEGTAREFADRSRALQRKGSGIHAINPVRASVHGDRALVESTGGILIRSAFAGREYDLTSWCRWLSRASRTRAGWRLESFDGIYHKDRLDPVDPGDGLPADWAECIAGRRPSYRSLSYLAIAHGNEPRDDLPGDDRPDLMEDFLAQARAWLEAEP